MQTNLTEQRLVRMWTATDYGGDWYELNRTLWEVAKQRAVDETQARKMKVAA